MQVKKEHYYRDYDDMFRFISYFHQIDLLKQLDVKKVLEIGVGNFTVSNYLRQHGYDLTTCDYDKTLNPDYVADVRKLPFKDASYDVVLCYEVLEHIPFPDMAKALSEVSRVSRKYAIISIPYPSLHFAFFVQFPFIHRIFKRPYLNFSINIPEFFKKIDIEKNKQHYWEIGTKGYPISRVKKVISQQFCIRKEFRSDLQPYHYFFILEKKQAKDMVNGV